MFGGIAGGDFNGYSEHARFCQGLPTLVERNPGYKVNVLLNWGQFLRYCITPI